MPVEPVLKIAQFSPKLTNMPPLPIELLPLPKPPCWNATAPNVATNSSARPGAKLVVLVGVSRAASTRILPPATLAPPSAPLLHRMLDHPGGTAAPANSLPMVGPRITSPSFVTAT